MIQMRAYWSGFFWKSLFGIDWEKDALINVKEESKRALISWAWDWDEIAVKGGREILERFPWERVLHWLPQESLSLELEGERTLLFLCVTLIAARGFFSLEFIFFY